MDIKKYLSHVKRLEVSVYEQTRVIASIQQSITALENYKYVAKTKTRRYFDTWETRKKIGYFFFFPLFSTLIGALVVLQLLIKYDAPDPVTMMEKVGSIIMVCLPGLLFSLIIDGIIIAVNVGKTNKQNKNIITYNNTISQNNKTLLNHNSKKIVMLKEQLAVAKNNLQATRKLRDQLYSKNVIHKDYRGLIPICSIYGYFDRGICNRLDGHEGAYNRYDHDLQMRIIINKLDVIISQLEQIKDTQRELYNAISDCNRKIANINIGLKKIEQSTNNISRDMEISAYNSRISAENTTVMKYIMMYNQMK